MIIGIGIDLVDIGRIEKSIARFGNKLLRRLFTVAERQYQCLKFKTNCYKQQYSVPSVSSTYYAKCFAAKEACVKALGTGFTGGITWHDIYVINLASGKPVIQLSGVAAKQLAYITPPGATAEVNVSISDTHLLAQAVVIISAIEVSRRGDVISY